VNDNLKNDEENEIGNIMNLPDLQSFDSIKKLARYNIDEHILSKVR
jgi:hypothetical protein